MSKQRRIEEEFISQEAEKRLFDQLDEIENIDVEIQTDVLKAVQGKVDGVSVAGQGLVMQDIRVQEINLQTDRINVNPLSALFGQIQLEQPVNSTARILLQESDINHALLSDFVQSQIQRLELDVNGESVYLVPKEIQIHLLGSGRIALNSKILIEENNITQPISFTALVCPRTKHKPIMLENFNIIQGDGLSLEVVVALLNRVKKLLDLKYFTFEDMVFRIRDMEVQEGHVTILLNVHVREIPT